MQSSPVRDLLAGVLPPLGEGDPQGDALGESYGDLSALGVVGDLRQWASSAIAATRCALSRGVRGVPPPRVGVAAPPLHGEVGRARDVAGRFGDGGGRPKPSSWREAARLASPRMCLGCCSSAAKLGPLACSLLTHRLADRCCSRSGASAARTVGSRPQGAVDASTLGDEGELGDVGCCDVSDATEVAESLEWTRTSRDIEANLSPSLLRSSFSLLRRIRPSMHS